MAVRNGERKYDTLYSRQDVLRSKQKAEADGSQEWRGVVHKV